MRKQIFHLPRRKVCRGSTTPVKLHHRPFARNVARNMIHFAFQNFQIWRRNSLIFLNDHVGGAEQAQTFAEGKMHVQRNGSSRLVGISMHAFEMVRAERIVPHRCGRITGIARARLVVTSYKLLANRQLSSHFRKTWMDNCHSNTFHKNLRNILELSAPPVLPNPPSSAVSAPFQQTVSRSLPVSAAEFHVLNSEYAPPRPTLP